VEIRVKDTGIGMSESELTRAFDRYYRSGQDRAGTGLGLAISREYVRLHGGDVWATSEPGVGSEFVVTLPIDGADI
jgi:signal transduction histidine kinase